MNGKLKEKIKKIKGFTLIELLATIVILAIILVIAVPKIMNTIEQSKVGSFKSAAMISAAQVEKAYENSMAFGSATLPEEGSCMNISTLDIDKDEYESCTYTINEYGSAIVDIVGKKGGKFDGLVCEGATKGYADCKRGVLTENDEPGDTPGGDTPTDTPAACFTFSYDDLNNTATVSKYHIVDEIVSYDIDSTKCTAYFMSEEAGDWILDSDTIGTFCTGGKDTYNETMDDYIESAGGKVFYLIKIGILKNVVYGGDYSHCLSDVVIPNTVSYNSKEYTVTTIGENAFTLSNEKAFNNDNSIKMLSNNLRDVIPTFMGRADICMGITSVVIPSTVTSIKNSAFTQNFIDTLSLPSGLTEIGYAAFATNRLTSIEIPGSVVTIGEEAFSYNSIETVTLHDGLKNIDKAAFSNNRITTLVIPNSVEYIMRMAFSENNITSLTIGTGVKLLGAQAFNSNENLENSGIADNHSGTMGVCYSTTFETFSNTSVSGTLPNTNNQCFTENLEEYFNRD